MTTNLSTQIRPGTYTIDLALSTCTMTATHAFGLKPVTATMAIRTGTVTVAADPAGCSASASLDAASFHSDDNRRDKDIAGKKFLNTAQHPLIGFRSTGCARSASGWQLTGILSVCGTDSEVTMSMDDITPTADGFTCTARCTVDRVTAGVRAARGLIARPVLITLAVVAKA